MNGSRIVSTRFPYIPIHLAIDGYRDAFDAMLDTGFDGDIVVPVGHLPNVVTPADQLPVRLADGSQMLVATHVGVVRIGVMEVADVLVYVLGDVPLIGTNLIRHFAVTLDHGRRVIVEP
jgi:predicted aspartyl protease